jgi:antagonist of KipI
MKIFRVLKPGMFTTIQDTGRHGYLRFGVPVSGAMDSFSLTAANALVENCVNCACLETTLIGPELQTLAQAQIAITGGSCAPTINGHEAPMWRTLNLQIEDVLSFGRMESGCRAYVAVKGGIDLPSVLGSRSTYVRGGFGGIDGRQLKAGDEIEVCSAPFLSAGHQLPEELIPVYSNNLKVHVILGPQAGMFTDKGTETFFSNPYKVTSEADRMGYRLEGSAIEHKDKADFVSDALLPGAIQVPRSQNPIVMMKDAQTTGGYPKIAVVASADLDLLGQAKPNDEIRFSKITTRQAHNRIRQYRRLLKGLSAKLQKASA